MHRPTLLPWLTRAAASSAAILLSSPLFAQAPAAKPTNADAVAACERAARQSLAPQSANPPEVKFTSGPTVQPGLSNDSQLVLQGAATWRAASGQRSFSFSCNVDLRNPESVGLVMRDSTPATAEAAPARKIDPDLSFLSPAACESSAAAALKQRWPRVSQISFDSGTRTLSQESATKAQLHGQGRALPAPDAVPTLFGFDCEVDPRNGQVIATRISG